MAVWVANLARYYREAARILIPDGLFVINEYHPFRRIRKASTNELAVAHRYLDAGPHQRDYTSDILSRERGAMPGYEHHWTLSDYLNAVIDAGCRIVGVEEFGERVGAWQGAPTHGLPEFLLVVARRHGVAS